MVIFEFVEESLIGTKDEPKVVRDDSISNISKLGHAYFQHSQGRTTNLFFKRGRVALISRRDIPYSLLGNGSPKRLREFVKEYWGDPE